MHDIILSSSSRFYPLVIELRDALERIGLSVLTPDLEFVSRAVSPARKKKLTTDFLKKISGSAVVCVVTDDSGYVGRSVSLEIGFAYAIGKPIVCLRSLEDPALAALCKKLASFDVLVRFAKTHKSRTASSKRRSVRVA